MVTDRRVEFEQRILIDEATSAGIRRKHSMHQCNALDLGRRHEDLGVRFDLTVLVYKVESVARCPVMA